VHPILVRELNAYDVLVSDRVVFTRESLPNAAPKPTETPVGITITTDDTGEEES